ncbi:hypothetical protein Prudu_022858, partial [Prunus dulcis]
TNHGVHVSLTLQHTKRKDPLINTPCPPPPPLKPLCILCSLHLFGFKSQASMADSKCSDSSTRSMMNPWVLHFQKLGLELKCSLCLSLLHRPTLLPCNHIFCNSCIPNSTHFGKECPLCKVQVADRDLRPAPFMENIVAIYKSLDASFCANLLQPISSDVRTVSPNISFAGKMAKESFDNGQGGNSNSGQSIYSSGANERVWVPCSLNRSVADVIDTNCKVDKCVMPIDGFNGVGNPNSPPSSQIRAGGLEECMTIERDMNQVAQSLPDSPPSFGDTKCSDNDSSIISESSLVRKSISEIDDSRTGLKRHDSSATENDVSTTNSELEHGFRTSSNTICAFCQSSTISEVTGPILHYANEKLVMGDEAAVSNAIPVHRICIDWAPQVYFVGESVKKLKAEVARGAKLKCSIGMLCEENFLLLCPAHCSVKFPNEKSNSENPKICPLSNSWVASNGAKEWILCPSGLSSEEKLLLIKFAKMNGGTVSKIWRPEVTHVIAAVDEDGAYVRTLKTCMAILAGRWILKIDWVKACMEAMHHVDEPYEVSLDNYGCHDGPKTGRLRALNKDPKLFNGLSFYFAEEALEQSSLGQAASRTLVVYNLDPQEGCKLGKKFQSFGKVMSKAANM